MQEIRERWGYPRFFSENIDTDNKKAYITGEDARHLSSVLRMKCGDKAIISDMNCTDYLCTLTECSKTDAVFDIVQSRRNMAEPDIEVTLYQAVPKGDKLDFIVQKAVELGVFSVVPYVSKRCVSRPDEKSAAKKQQRLQRIAYEAAKQSGRGIVPTVQDFTDFKSAINSLDADTMAILFYESGGQRLNTLDFSKKKLAIFIGSEGGFEEAEVQYAKEKGVQLGYLGERILRTETASIAALSVLMNMTENL